MPASRAPRGGFLRRFVGVVGVIALCFALALAAIRVFAPAWWAVPGLVLGAIDQQVPRESAAVGPALASKPAAGTSTANTPAGNTPVGGTPATVGPQPPSASQSNPASPAETPAPASGLLGSLTAGVTLPQHRFNILLLGSDNDKKFTADAVLTQSMILISIDPSTHQVSMVSIPRDFWVPIPTFGDQKIDVAYEVGGIALARTTVEDLFGVHVDYYAWVGLDGLVNVIDSLGGVNITVLHPILDETYPDDLTGQNPYAFFRLYIPAGPQHLDGTTALEYVRSRHGDLQSDFGRSARQQQVLLAIKDLATDPGTISHIPDLAASLSGSVKTDLTLPQIVLLANMARGIGSGQIHQQVLAAPQYAELGWSPDHQEQIVIPDWQAIRPVMAELLNLHPAAVSDALAEQARGEKATIRVLNGTGDAGLAQKAKDYFAWQGLNVVSTGNASRFDYSHSQILVRDETKRSTVQALATTLDAPAGAAQDPTLSTDVVVILGKDHPEFPVLLGGSDAAPPQTDVATPSPSVADRGTPTPISTVVRSTPTAVRAGYVVVPSLIGMPEAAAQRLISESGLMTTYVNYQTANDVADRAYFQSIAPGAVLSQLPPAGTTVPRGTRVNLAVKKA